MLDHKKNPHSLLFEMTANLLLTYLFHRDLVKHICVLKKITQQTIAYLKLYHLIQLNSKYINKHIKRVTKRKHPKNTS